MEVSIIPAMMTPPLACQADLHSHALDLDLLQGICEIAVFENHQVILNNHQMPNLAHLKNHQNLAPLKIARA